MEHIVYDCPLRNLVERINQYLKDGTESFDDPPPTMRSSFERVLSWPSRFQFFHMVLTNASLGRAPVEWNFSSRLEGSELGRS